jgi:hydrogenase/urease accessory protein HupE
MIRCSLRFCAAALAFVPVSASAHVGVGDTYGFVHGFSHPIGGINHVLAMVAVGLFAAHLGGRALWLVPLSLTLHEGQHLACRATIRLPPRSAPGELHHGGRRCNEC